MISDSSEKWSWSHDDSFHGPFDDREDAIFDASGTDYQNVTVSKCRMVRPEEHVTGLDAEEIIGLMNDEFDSDEFFAISDDVAAQEALEKMLAAWAAVFITCEYWEPIGKDEDVSSDVERLRAEHRKTECGAERAT